MRVYQHQHPFAMALRPGIGCISGLYRQFFCGAGYNARVRFFAPKNKALVLKAVYWLNL